jgi:uncharacterized Zn finger protein
MEVLKDGTDFSHVVVCSHCASVLKSTDPNDFDTKTVVINHYNQNFEFERKSEIKELLFTCPACGEQNKIQLHSSGLTPFQIEQIQSSSLPATS